MRRRFYILGTATLACCLQGQAAVEVGKTYRIVPDANAEKSLFVENASLAEKAPVVVWTETNVPAQQWQVVDAGNGTVAFRNVYTGLYMDASNLSLRQQREPSAWTLEAVDEANNEYLLKQQKYLRVVSTTDGRQPMVGNNAQTWHLVEVAPQTAFTASERQRMLDGFLRQYMQDKGNGYRTFLNGGWGEAETMEAILDCYEATGDHTYLNIFKACYSYLRYHVGLTWNGGTAIGDYNWYGYDFNDDVMWLIIAAARAYHLTGETNYLNDAKRNFDLIWNRAYLGYVGLLRWAEYTGDRNGANSCINGPAEVAACYIAAGTGDESYYEKARELYENQRKHLFVPTTGQVYDCVVFDPETATVTSRNTWASTYNQGTMLGAAVLLYRHYGDSQYKQDADRILAYARQNLCNEYGLVHVCQNADGDFQGFKGILMRYAGLYCREFADADSRTWLIKNAFHAYNNLNSHGFGHSAWLTKAGEDLMYNDVNYGTAGSAFGASTAMRAACGATLEKGEKLRQLLSATEAVKESDQKMTFSLEAPRSGRYRLNVFYRSETKQTFYMTANQADAVICTFPASKERLNRLPLFVTLAEGSNSITFTATSGLPQIEKIEVVFLAAIHDALEAEYATATGQVAVADDEAASGGRYVRNIGNGDNNVLTFKLDALNAGRYQLNIVYFAGQTRQMYTRVNGVKASESYPATGGWQASTAQVKQIAVTLKAGTNTIILGNDTGQAPYVDRIFITPENDGTAVETIRTTPRAASWYTLSGMRIGQPATTGIYVNGNEKYYVKK